MEDEGEGACPAGIRRVVSRRAAAVIGPPLLAVLGIARPGVPAAREALGGPVRFRIMRAGSAIGTHTVTLETAPGGDGRVARSVVDVAVRIAGILVYRYRHRFAETWSAEGRLLAVTSFLDRNGSTATLEGRAEADGFALNGPDGAARLPAEAAPLTWWNPAIFRRPLLFDPRTGRALRLRVERRDRPGGGFVIEVSGDSDGIATYDAAGRWVAHALTGDDGSTVTYERIG